jgi:hypothetical protein
MRRISSARFIKIVEVDKQQVMRQAWRFPPEMSALDGRNCAGVGVLGCGPPNGMRFSAKPAHRACGRDHAQHTIMRPATDNLSLHGYSITGVKKGGSSKPSQL